VTVTGNAVNSFSRPQGRRKKGTSSKTSRPFVPTDAQIICAMRKIEGVLRKYHGSWYCVANLGNVHQELMNEVHFHGSQLGKTNAERRETLRIGFERLVEEGKVYLTENSAGQQLLILKEKELRPVKSHEDKYARAQSHQRSRTLANA